MKKFLILLIMGFTLLIPTAVMAANPLPMTTNAIAQSLIVTTDATALNFTGSGANGAVVVGTDSNTITLNITNGGNVRMDVTAVVSGADSTFYGSSLMIEQNGGWVYASGWSYPSLAKGASITVNLKVHPTTANPNYVGNLNFVGTTSAIQ